MAAGADGDSKAIGWKDPVGDGESHKGVGSVTVGCDIGRGQHLACGGAPSVALIGTHCVVEMVVVCGINGEYDGRQRVAPYRRVERVGVDQRADAYVMCECDIWCEQRIGEVELTVVADGAVGGIAWCERGVVVERQVEVHHRVATERGVAVDRR